MYKYGFQPVLSPFHLYGYIKFHWANVVATLPQFYYIYVLKNTSVLATFLLFKTWQFQSNTRKTVYTLMLRRGLIVVCCVAGSAKYLKSNS